MMIRRRVNGAQTFGNEIAAANRVLNDETVIENFFKDYLEQLQAGGLKVDHKNTTKTNGKQYIFLYECFWG